MGAGSVRARRPVVFGQEHVGNSDQLAKAPPPDSIQERDTIAWRRPEATVAGSAAASLFAIEVANGVSAIGRAIAGWGREDAAARIAPRDFAHWSGKSGRASWGPQSGPTAG
jgi:hypothetical protein